MRYDIIFYILGVLNIFMSILNSNAVGALGWFCAVLYAWAYYLKDAKNETRDEK